MERAEMQARPRVTILLVNEMFVRNYLASGAFRSLEERAAVTILAAEPLRRHEATLRQSPGFAGFIDVDRRVARRHTFLFNVLMWRHRRRSTSFAFRARRHLGWEHVHRFRRSRGRHRVGALVDLLRHHRHDPTASLILVLGWPGVAELFTALFVRFALPVNESLRQHVAASAPDVLVVPSSAYDALGNDAVRVARELRVCSLLLVDNWDNLSSKSIMWAAPDHVAVWGPQSRAHAERIHRVPPGRIHEIGTPRFDEYFVAREREPSASPFPFRFVLFLGVSLPFDEVTALHVLDAELSGSPEIYGDTRIVYRPHPWRQGRTSEEPFSDDAFERVMLDPQIRALRSSGETLPALEYYVPLLQHASVVVAPLTTMLIESAIFSKRTIVLAYDDGIHFTSSHNALKAYEHFEGIERLRGVTLCHELDDLGPLLRREHAAGPADIDGSPDPQLAHYLHEEARRYPDRLADLVLSITDGDGEDLVTVPTTRTA